MYGQDLPDMRGVSMALTQQELNKMGCGVENCGHDHSELFLKQRCHIHKGCDVKYIKATGLLRVMCRQCHRLVAEIKVADD